MNVQQQALVEKLLGAACAEDTCLSTWLAEAKEPILVQNLESVQGRERDVILFSLNYGPGEDGKVSMAFGPLTKEGGHRRFNVAISRAREEMVVFASLNAEDISLGNTESRGVIALHDFLIYAKTGILPRSNVHNVKGNANPIADSICKALTAKGWELKRDLGRSAFHVDIAVIDPEDSKRYQTGILLDEDVDFNKDELCAQLRDGGWNIVQVHTLDWLNSPEAVMAEIFSALEKARKKTA